MRAALSLMLTLLLALPLAAQDVRPPDGAPASDRTATGGAQTLEDILARQRGEAVPPKTGDAASTAQDLRGQLGTLGGASDPDLWRALRYGEANVSVSAGGDVAKVLVQDGGMAWYEFRRGPLSTYGAWLLLGTLAVLALFFLIRGRIRVDAPMTGRTVLRFRFVERFAHWLLASSFILLGFTGLFVKYGRDYIAPVLGREFNATLLVGSKFVHNNVAWAFILALVLVFVFWVAHNLPSRTDLTWIAQAGGIVGRKHPPAKKFNAGQKLIFWSVILLGGSISMSGLSLLFPFEMPLFAKTFGILNDIGVPGWFGYGPLPTTLSPQEEMQLAQAWHAIVSFVLMAIVLAHIYIGTLGMQGAYDAMGSGRVDEAWAKQHHSIWYDRIKGRRGADRTTPAE